MSITSQQFQKTVRSIDKVKLWNISGKKQREFIVKGSGVYGVSFSPDGQHLATAEVGGVIRDLSGEELSRYRSPENTVGTSDISFSPNGKRVVMTSLYGVASVWDFKEAPSETERSWQAVADPAGFWHVYFSPDKKHIVTVKWDEPRVAKIWDLSSLTKPIADFKKIRSITFDRQGQLFVTREDGIIYLWDASDPHQLTNRLDLQGSIKYASFSSDGQQLVTAGEDNMIRLWHISRKNTPEKLLE